MNANAYYNLILINQFIEASANNITVKKRMKICISIAIDYMFNIFLKMQKYCFDMFFIRHAV